MILELVNSNTQTVASGNKLNLGAINIKECSNGSVVYNGTDTITFRQNGIYQVITKVNAISTVATQLLEYAIDYDGTVSNIANAGAYAVDTDQLYTLVIPKKIKICNAPLSISLVNSGTDTTDYQGLIVDISRG